MKNYLTAPLLLEFRQEHLLHTRRKHQNNNNDNDKVNIKRSPRLRAKTHWVIHIINEVPEIQGKHILTFQDFA